VKKRRRRVLLEHISVDTPANIMTLIVRGGMSLAFGESVSHRGEALLVSRLMRSLLFDVESPIP